MGNIENFFKNKKENNSEIYLPMETKKEPKKEELTKESRSTSWKIWIGVPVLIIVLGSVGSAGYFYRQYKKAVANPSAAAQDEARSIVEKIGKFMVLPDEQPTMATVADKDKLKGQMFFSSAENGDKVLIFAKSQKAILYRPSTGKVIEVASLSGQAAPAAAASATDTTTSNSSSIVSGSQPAPDLTLPPNATSNTNQAAMTNEQVKIAVYNGSNIKGLAQTLTKEIAGMPNIQVTDKTNAKGNYTDNLVIDITGGNGAVAQQIADKIGGTVGSLPAAETKPDGADVLVIGGKIKN